MVGRQKISKEQKDKVFEGHRLGYSTLKTAKYAGVSQTAVRYNWNKAGLKPNFKSLKGGLTQEQKDKVFEGHRLGYSTLKTAKYAGVSQPTVRYNWKKAGLKVHFTKYCYGLNEEQINKIYELRDLGCNSPEVAKSIGVSNKTVLNYWRKKGLEPNYKHRILQEQVDKIFEGYTLGYTANKTAKYAGVDRLTVLNYWRKKGLEPYKQGISQEQEDKIFEGHRLGYSTLKTAKYAGVDRSTVLNHWHKKGLEPYKQGIPQEQKDKIFEGHTLGYTVHKTAEYAGVSLATVSREWNKAGLKPHFHSKVLTKKAKETLETIADWPDEEKIIILGALPSHKKYNKDDLRKAVKRDERYPKATLGPLKVNYDTNRQYDVQQQVYDLLIMNPKVINDKKALDLLVNKIFSVYQGKVSNNPDTIDEVIDEMKGRMERLENV